MVRGNRGWQERKNENELVWTRLYPERDAIGRKEMAASVSLLARRTEQPSPLTFPQYFPILHPPCSRHRTKHPPPSLSLTNPFSLQLPNTLSKLFHHLSSCFGACPRPSSSRAYT